MSAAATIRAAVAAPLANSAEPLDLARCLQQRHYKVREHATLVRWAHAWWTYDGIRFTEIDDEWLARAVYKFLDVVEVEVIEETDGGRTLRRKRITARAKTASEVTRALLGVVPMLGPNMPQWTARLDGEPAAEQLVACTNGLLDMESLRVIEPTPRFFATTALGCAWDPAAPEPVEWLAFLRSIWGDDEESIRTLRQIFGYFLTADTSQQKLFALVGPKRSGKGTIARILKALLGTDAVVNPTLDSLERPFGLAAFVGKSLAIIGDARLGGRSEQATVVERLLSISGEDPILIDRKNRDPVNVRLRTRVLLISNELPRLYDASGALASRFVILQMTRSFYGAEDTGLEQKLLAELPGILRWAMDGRRDLAESGRFCEPAASLQAADDLLLASSPVTAFLRDLCVVDEMAWVECGTLYSRYQGWCESNGNKPTSAQGFGRDLRAVVPGLSTTQPRLNGGQRERRYHGIGLRTGGNA